MFRFLNDRMMRLTARLRSEEGQTMAEYAIVLALVAVVAATAFSGVASAITTELGKVATAIGGTVSGG